MQNISLLQKVLIRHEGSRTQVYKDSLGLPTVGVGHLVLSKDNLNVGDTITPQQLQAFFDADCTRSIHIAASVCSTLSTLDDVRWVVVVSLAFNMGNRLAGFPMFLAALNKGDYKEAATQLENSKWYTEVGRRGPELCNAMLTGKFGFAT